ncbi:MAG TPA: cytochrome c oxidase assembly protein [Candidatus Dormibacteraeota bacterium]|nr:cytochrome c oxidase assembly protein [Candidatus Dormibacteraeota bacterium]
MNFWAPWGHLYGYAFQPGAWIPVLLAALLYWIGRRRMALQPTPDQPRIGPWRAFSFYAGLAILLFAYEGPIDYLSYHLFWMHMVEHCLFQMVAAPLLLVGCPLLPWWRALPSRWTESIAPKGRAFGRHVVPTTIGHLLQKPAVGLAALAATFWTWHVPYVFDVALHNGFLHGFEFVTLLLGGLVYWSQTVDSYPLRRHLMTWPLIGYLIAGTAVMWIVAISLGFSGHSWYAPYYNLAVRPGEISALTDQQWGAGVAWVPAAIPAEIMLDIAVLQWLRDDERRADAEVALYRSNQAAGQDQSTPKGS